MSTNWARALRDAMWVILDKQYKLTSCPLICRKAHLQSADAIFESHEQCVTVRDTVYDFINSLKNHVRFFYFIDSLMAGV